MLQLLDAEGDTDEGDEGDGDGETVMVKLREKLREKKVPHWSRRREQAP